MLTRTLERKDSGLPRRAVEGQERGLPQQNPGPLGAVRGPADDGVLHTVL